MLGGSLRACVSGGAGEAVGGAGVGSGVKVHVMGAGSRQLRGLRGCGAHGGHVRMGRGRG